MFKYLHVHDTKKVSNDIQQYLRPGLHESSFSTYTRPMHTHCLASTLYSAAITARDETLRQPTRPRRKKRAIQCLTKPLLAVASSINLAFPDTKALRSSKFVSKETS